jgi:hypothetical protein
MTEKRITGHPVRMGPGGEILKRQSSVWLSPETFEQAERLADLYGMPGTRYFSKIVEKAVGMLYETEFDGKA